MDHAKIALEDGSNATQLAVEEGRYIKGDPLNGYYDFIITEGSYKFWVVFQVHPLGKIRDFLRLMKRHYFQLATAALLIYSTLAAIYYSKVNPLTSDYDYVDYLSRSFKGRAISEDSADVDDEGAIEPARTYLSSLSNNQWTKAAAYGFQFAMDAIDKIPK